MENNQIQELGHSLQKNFSKFYVITEKVGI